MSIQNILGSAIGATTGVFMGVSTSIVPAIFAMTLSLGRQKNATGGVDINHWDQALEIAAYTFTLFGAVGGILGAVQGYKALSSKNFTLKSYTCDRINTLFTRFFGLYPALFNVKSS